MSYRSDDREMARHGIAPGPNGEGCVRGLPGDIREVPDLSDFGTITVRHDAIAQVLQEVRAERERQEVKWGEQNHPSFAPGYAFGTGATADERCEYYGLRTEEEARRREKIAFSMGSGSWGHILGEELSESYGAKDTRQLRYELIQCAAVIVAWIESIDRNGK